MQILYAKQGKSTKALGLSLEVDDSGESSSGPQLVERHVTNKIMSLEKVFGILLLCIITVLCAFRVLRMSNEFLLLIYICASISA